MRIEPLPPPAGADGSGELGFTLLELLVALAIVAIVIFAQVAPFRRAIESRDRAEAAMARSNAARVTLDRLAEELTGAVALKGRSFAVADVTLDRPASELSFATTAARRMHAGPQDPIEIVSYRLEPPRPGEWGARLVKQQSPSLAAEGSPPPAPVVVLDDVAGFHVTVRPPQGRDWLPTWRGGDGGRSQDLPRAVAMELLLADGDGEPTPYRTTVALPMGPRS